MEYSGKVDAAALAAISMDVKKLVFNKFPYLQGQRFIFGKAETDMLVLPGGGYMDHEVKGLLGWKNDGRADGAAQFARENADEVARCLAAMGLDAVCEERVKDPEVFGKERLTGHEFIVRADVSGDRMRQATEQLCAEQVRHLRELAQGWDERLGQSPVPAQLCEFVIRCFDEQVAASPVPYPPSIDLRYSIGDGVRVYAGNYPELTFSELGYQRFEEEAQFAGMRALVLGGVLRLLSSRPNTLLVTASTSEFQFGHGGPSGDVVTAYFDTKTGLKSW